MKKYAAKNPFVSDTYGKCKIDKMKPTKVGEGAGYEVGAADDRRSLPAWDKPLSKRLTF